MVVNIERADGIAVVTVDNPPVNATSQPVRQGLWEAAENLDADPGIRGVVLACAGRTFIAGADVREFGKPPEPPHLPDLIARIERADKPWAAAIHGSALGGGLEVTLGCRFRVAAPGAKLGLPEVTLGVVPGAGGTVRLPRLVPAEDAIEIATTGKPVDAAQAEALGLVDAVVEGDLVTEARAFLQVALTRPLPDPLTARPPVSSPDPAFWEAQEAAITRRAKGQAAPLRAMECLRRSIESDLADAFAHERATFLELRETDQAKALRHVFFAERAAARPPEVKGIEPRALGSAGVVGGGTMGAGIATAMLAAGIPVTLVERDDDAAARARDAVARLVEAGAKRGRINADGMDRLAVTADYDELAGTDLVVEAVFEDRGVKRDVFARLDAACRPDAVLATNTSYLDPGDIAGATRHPERVLGLHFFSPAHVMKLLEIVPAAHTDGEVLATGFALARRLGKVPVLAGICDGFIGNRILKVTRAQAERLLLAGAQPSQVDAAMRAFGQPMGPFEAQDLGGLDIAAAQRKAARDRGEAVFAPVADRLVAAGRLGQKTGGGWYDYADGDRSPQPSQAVEAIIAEEAARAGLPPVDLSETGLAERILFPMVDEGARILDEGVARRAADIDLVEIHGYGFPRWRGGLMHWAEARGLDDIVASLDSMAAEGAGPAPGERLRRAAREGGFGD
ncbi:3-hydroxyacyl-CoA dehydrogenase [Rhodobacteraceae bacterium WD3A24]|nr:3-hydroxyacyl-CoA dehydrogenase [Rhodobacteraceae bacterium WD3A24]